MSVITAARAQLARELAAVGIRSGCPVLVHSSLSSLGHVPGGPNTVIDALLDAVGPAGTLVIPTLSYLFVTADSPSFDVRSTPTNLGAIPTAALARPGAVRSMHPTHSCVALGADVEAVVGAHALDRTPVGSRSPFARVRDLGGQVVFLGCGTRCNTSIHGVEEELPVHPPYLLLPETIEYSITDAAGVTARVMHQRHNFKGTAQRYERLAGLIPAGGGAGGAVPYASGHVGSAEVHVFDARAMWATAAAALAADTGCLTQAVSAADEEGHHLKRGSSGAWRYTVGAAPPQGNLGGV